VNGFIRFEFHDPIALGEKGEIISDPYELAGTELGPALAHDNTSSTDLLSAKNFDAKPLGI